MPAPAWIIRLGAIRTPIDMQVLWPGRPQEPLCFSSNSLSLCISRLWPTEFTRA
jgi:hypothetical protein